MRTRFSAAWTTPVYVNWSAMERALTAGMPYPVAKGFVEARRRNHRPDFYLDIYMPGIF